MTDINEDLEQESEEEEEAKACFHSSTPNNALLLRRRRSAMYNSSYLANRIWVFTFEKWSNIAKSKVQSKRTEKKDNLTSEREFIYRGSGQE